MGRRLPPPPKGDAKAAKAYNRQQKKLRAANPKGDLEMIAEAILGPHHPKRK